MPTTITIDLPDVSGEAGPFSIWLRKRSDQALVNTGGDSLTEIEVATVKTGVWSATIAETIPAEDCHARVYEGTTETPASIIAGGILFNGQTEVGKEAAGGDNTEILAKLPETGRAASRSDISSIAPETTIVTLQAAAGISPGVIVGPLEPLVIGDDYLSSLNRSIRINLLDSTGNPANVDFGSYALDDAGISIQLLLARSGKPSTIADVVGTCTFFPAGEVGGVVIPPYLIVEFTKVETAKAIPGPYDMQAEAVWSDGKVVTFAPYGQLSFVRNIRRAV